MPAGRHSKKQPGRELFSGNNGIRVGHELWLDQFFSLISLTLDLRRSTEDRQENRRRHSQAKRQRHPITYHSQQFAATCKPAGKMAREMLHLSLCVLFSPYLPWQFWALVLSCTRKTLLKQR